MIKYDGTKEQLKKALTTLRSFRLNACPVLFDEIFGEELGEKYWNIYIDNKHGDLIAFWGYVDEAYKEVLLNYLLLNTSQEKQTESQ